MKERIGEVTGDIYIERICPNCGAEIGLLKRDLDRNFKEYGTNSLKIRCPKCYDGILLFKNPLNKEVQQESR